MRKQIAFISELPHFSIKWLLGLDHALDYLRSFAELPMPRPHPSQWAQNFRDGALALVSFRGIMGFTGQERALLFLGLLET